MTHVEKISFAGFFRRPAEALERIFGCEKIQREIEVSAPNEVAKLWQRCNDFASNPQMEKLNEGALHDIAFSILLTKALENLQSIGRLPSGYIKHLWRDRPNFMHRAYEAEIASYFVSIGYHGTRLGEPDIVIPMPQGNHFVACKKVRSATSGERYCSSVESHLNKAVDQVSQLGNGTVIIEVNSSRCSIDKLQERLASALSQCSGVNAISQVFITWWDRNLVVSESEGREERMYAARRHSAHIPGITGAAGIMLPHFAGETIEWIYVPPSCDIRLSSVARSDAWLMAVWENWLRPEAFATAGIPVRVEL